MKKKKIIVEIALLIDMGVYVNQHSCMGARANCNKSIKIIEIGLEQALLVGFVYFLPHLNMQKTVDYGPPKH